MKKLKYFIIQLSIILIAGCKKDTFKTDIVTKDIDGNVYDTVRIGSQLWMAENLKTTKYNDCTSIPLVTDSLLWLTATSGAYCWYNNDELTNKNTYGALYNWYAVYTAKLCPTGWRVPTIKDWTTLISFLGDSIIAGNKLKETGERHWISPNNKANNLSGFTALPGGWRYREFSLLEHIASWWTSDYTAKWLSDHWEILGAYSMVLGSGNSKVEQQWGSPNAGFSVRCVKE